MAYLKDPGDRFASDTHRRVLAYLTTPDDEYGWSLPALFERMRPDIGTNLETREELAGVLAELQQDGHADAVGVEGTQVWRMTQDGFDVLTGSIADEPPPGAAVQGPAIINAPGLAGATMLSGKSVPAGNVEDQASINADRDLGGETEQSQESVPEPDQPPAPPQANPEGGVHQ